MSPNCVGVRCLTNRGRFRYRGHKHDVVFGSSCWVGMKFVGCGIRFSGASCMFLRRDSTIEESLQQLPYMDVKLVKAHSSCIVEVGLGSALSNVHAACLVLGNFNAGQKKSQNEHAGQPYRDS